ncbi:F-box protein [Thalictrum thalictroides]|uniref:F-box protein n=1 Tax=Thalictrum thalictroides TaxID=46969 RepID=A0A7J6X362_THATH|nr:F-box protein [Thalictrum thalictroides]
MAQKGKKGTYLDGRTFAEVCKPGGRGRNNVNYYDDKLITEDCCEDDGRGIVDMNGSKNKELSSDNNVSKVCIDIRSYVDMPFEIIYDIFLRLPIEDIVRCKSVCQTWYNLTREPDFIGLQANRSALCPPQRILLVPEDNIDSLFLLDNEKCIKIPLKNFELSHHYRVASCCNGLLCIASNLKPDEPVFIYNPITGECNELPKQDFKPFNTQGILYGFAFDRFSNKYKVVCVYCPDYWDTDYWYRDVTVARMTMGEIITEGEDSWRKLEIPYQIQFSHGSETVFLDDAFHWMINRNHPTSGSEFILALDINNEKFHTLQLPPVELPDDSLSLINFAGSLAFVEFDTLSCSSKIWKIVSSETNDRWICEYTFKYVSENDGLRYYYTVLGSTDDGNLVYQATQDYQANEWLRMEFREPCNQLGIYIPEKKESFLLNMQGSPHRFQAVLFAPTLISSKTLYFPRVWSPAISIKVMSRKEKPGKRRSGRR